MWQKTRKPTESRVRHQLREAAKFEVFPPSGEFAVAVFVFFAGAAGAFFIAADFAPGGWVLGIALSLCAVAPDQSRRARRRSQSHFVLAGRRVDFVGFHVRQLGGFLGRRLGYDLHPHELAGDRFAQI